MVSHINFRKIGHVIKDIRHCGGLMLGMELTFPVKDVLGNCRENGIVFLTAGPNVIRMLPPLIVTEEQVTHTYKSMNWGLKCYFLYISKPLLWTLAIFC